MNGIKCYSPMSHDFVSGFLMGECMCGAQRRPHSANYTRQVLAENNIATLEWPSRYPDLSPIEHVWDILGRRIYAQNDVNNVRQLEAALLEEWANIPTASINKLINSMRKRCTTVIDKNGYHTRY